MLFNVIYSLLVYSHIIPYMYMYIHTGELNSNTTDRKQYYNYIPTIANPKGISCMEMVCL